VIVAQKLYLPKLCRLIMEAAGADLGEAGFCM